MPAHFVQYVLPTRCHRAYEEYINVLGHLRQWFVHCRLESTLQHRTPLPLHPPACCKDVNNAICPKEKMIEQVGSNDFLMIVEEPRQFCAPEKSRSLDGSQERNGKEVTPLQKEDIAFWSVEKEPAQSVSVQSVVNAIRGMAKRVESALQKVFCSPSGISLENTNI